MSAKATDAPAQGSLVRALEAARVDLVALVRAGIPTRRFVPGAEGWLLPGKRYLLVAPAGSGKSLIALIAAVDVVAAGGTVAIVDVDMGKEEYARRLADILAAREDHDTLARDCEERLHYYAYPLLKREWSAEEWATAFAEVDGVIFDSSRLMLSAHGLAEDSNDDYATFAAERLVPLSQAGQFTIMLDNTGHGDRTRPRGAKAKDDLNEVVYSIKTGAKFDRKTPGHLTLAKQRSRIPEIPDELRVPVGGGTYGPVGVPNLADVPHRNEELRLPPMMERLSRAIEKKAGMGVKELRDEVSGNNELKTHALAALVESDHVRIAPDGQVKRHFSESPYRVEDEQKGSGYA